MASWSIGPVAAALFDLDGVLVDSMAAIDWCMRTWAAERDLDPDLVIALSHGRRDVDILAHALPGRDPGPELARIAELDVVALPRVRAVPGTAALLAALEPGTWAVVTSGTPDISRARLEAAGLPLPDLLITAEDVVAGKPDPEGYLLAARRLGVAVAETVVFEDAPAGIEAAAAAGARVVQIGSGARSALAAARMRDLSGLRLRIAAGSRLELDVTDEA